MRRWYGNVCWMFRCDRAWQRMDRSSWTRSAVDCDAGIVLRQSYTVQYMKLAEPICLSTSMELRHLRYFVEVASARNFTRAAEKLGIGQPPLSQQIKSLERELGVELFRRTAHAAELTGAGEAFLIEAQRVLGGAQRAAQAAQRAARGETGRLRIGFTGSAA